MLNYLKGCKNLCFCCNWLMMMIHMFENHFAFLFTVRNHGIASDKPAHVPIAPTSSISTSDSLDAQT